MGSLTTELRRRDSNPRDRIMSPVSDLYSTPQVHCSIPAQAGKLPRKLSYPRATVPGMKIYSVTVLEPGNKTTRHLWQSYQSATQSFGYWERRHGEGNVLLECVHVPEENWKPVDRATEEKLNRVAVLWEQLVASDQEGLDALLDDLVKRLAPVKKPAILNEDEKTQARAALDRLVA